MRRASTLRTALWILALAACYTVVAKFALDLDAVSGFAALVWPATGISLVATLRLGYQVWPGIAAGAFFVNAWAGAPLPVAAGIALGNTAEALLGAFALQRVAGFRGSLARVRDTLAFIGFAAIASTLVSAIVGTSSLRLGRVIGGSQMLETWQAWWIGDAMGNLIIAPPLLTWTSRREDADSEVAKASERRGSARLEAVLLAVTLGATSLLLFGLRPDGSPVSLRHAYMIFPLLIWSGLAFGTRGASVAVFVVSGIAVSGAALGRGPFQDPRLAARLMEMQMFMAVVATTTLILGSASEERRRALAMRESMISIVAHELKTPLTSLLLRAQKLGRSLRTDSAASASASADAAALERLAKRIARLVDDLLEVSRMAAGEIAVDLQDVDLRLVVSEVVERLPDSQQSLVTVQAPPDPIVGRWDRMRLDQVVTNLVANAIKYGEQKPVVVTLETHGRRARLLVTDRGIGIAPQDQQRIFERYERAAARNLGGFGMGLWIVRQVVRALRGTIEVESRVGEGSTFTVELPI